MNEQIGASPDPISGKANFGPALETCMTLELDWRDAEVATCIRRTDTKWTSFMTEHGERGKREQGLTTSPSLTPFALSEMNAPSVNHSFSILINSSDGFEDCWQPFFTLFSRYWQNCDVPILLNTELKDWVSPGLQIQCTQVQRYSGSTKRLTWSECLAGALSQVKTPLVLYMQEDYFLERPVDVPLILDLAESMHADPSVKVIGLTHFGSEGPFQPTKDPRLWEISRKARYRISTQAALWRVEALRSYLRPWENGWMFEIFGTRRAWRKRERFLTLDRDVYNPQNAPAIQYLHTGIIKGKWHPDIPKVFERHGIAMDFHKRGFYKPERALTRRLKLLRMVAAHPVYAAKSFFR